MKYFFYDHYLLLRVPSFLYLELGVSAPSIFYYMYNFFVQKYFFAALIGSDEYIYNYYVLPKESGVYRMGYTVESSSTSNLSISHEHRLFVGPKIRKDLMQRADNLELSIDMGWFWFLAQPMVLVMDWINGYINNWGITIVVFTVMKSQW